LATLSGGVSHKLETNSKTEEKKSQEVIKKRRSEQFTPDLKA